MTKHRRPLPFAAVVIAYSALFVFLAWPWLSGAVTIPWDAKAQSQPQIQFLASSLARGESPFWTPNLFAGWPQIADPQSLILSPLHLALAAIDPTPSFRAVDCITFAYVFAGGLALLLFFRDRGWHPGGGLAAALIFAFGGSAYSRIQHTSEVMSLAYAAIALWLLARTLDRASWRSAVAAGIAIGLLAIGRDQVAMLCLYVLALYVLAWWLDRPDRLARVVKTLLPLAICGAVALTFAAGPLVLTGLLAADSNRPSITYLHAAGGSLHPVLLLMLVFSDLYGAADPNVDFWGPPSGTWHMNVGASNIALAQNMGEIYCGILAVILILGVGIFRGRLLGRDIRFFAAALVLVLLYALGWYTPAFRLMYDFVPGVDLFRRPADATFIIGLLIAVLTGYLIHRVLSAADREPRWFSAFECTLIAAPAAIAFGVAHAADSVAVAVRPIETGLAFAAVAVALIAALRRVALARPWLATALVIGFVTFDLAWNNAPNESTGLPPARYEALKPQGNDPTVALLKAKLAETAAPDRRDRVELIGIHYHWPDVALAQNFDHLFGHNPLRLRDFTRATGVGDTVAVPAQRTFAPLYPSYRSTFADLAGVRFIATGVPVERIDPKLHEGDLKLIGRTSDAYVYENPRALPRVMLVPEYRIADFDELIRNGWGEFDPRRAVLLEHAPAAPAMSAAPAPPAAVATVAASGADGAAPSAATALENTARILRYANTEVDVEVNAPAGGFLLLTDVWHPWWRAWLDGQPVEILKADVLFRAVQVGPGRHRVAFSFAPFEGAWDELKQKLGL